MRARFNHFLSLAALLTMAASCSLAVAPCCACAQPFPSGCEPAHQLAGEAIQFIKHPQIALLPPIETRSAPTSFQSAAPMPLADPVFHAAESVPSLDPAATHYMPPPSPQMYYAPATEFGPKLRLFEPKARVYFDTGWEAPDKLDIFHDGSLSPSINFLEIFWAKPWDARLGREDWRWGPNVGVGINSPAGDSGDGTVEASGAPVLLLSYGFLLEFPLVSQTGYADQLPHRPFPRAGVEFGYALGVSSDESLDYSADGALYVGVSLHAAP